MQHAVSNQHHLRLTIWIPGFVKWQLSLLRPCTIVLPPQWEELRWKKQMQKEEAIIAYWKHQKVMETACKLPSIEIDTNYQVQRLALSPRSNTGPYCVCMCSHYTKIILNWAKVWLWARTVVCLPVLALWWTADLSRVTLPLALW